MKKFIVATLIIVGFIFYSFIYSHSNQTAVLPNVSTGSGSSSRSSNPAASTATPVAAGTSGATDTPGATNTSGGTYKDGSYTGSVADAQWGYIQVKAIIQNGKITDVQFLQYPNDHNRSVMINQYADPQLTSEAIQAQSANVDIITGATDSSQAFIQSLTDALAQAKA
jgi:uncharacterized protein with FMN-binding domain